MRFAFFPGCLIPARHPAMESAIRSTLTNLGIDIADLEGASCCPDPIYFKSKDKMSWLAVAARNLSLAEDLSVAENIYLGELPRKSFGRVDWAKLAEQTNAILKKLNVGFDAKTRVGDLSIANQQMVEIAKALRLDGVEQVVDGSLDERGLAGGAADAHVDDDLLEPRHLHDVLVTEFFHHRRHHFLLITYLHARHFGTHISIFTHNSSPVTRRRRSIRRKNRSHTRATITL